MEVCKGRIVVMGGSFNPPTLAHLQLLEQAVEASGARLGIFVPVSDAYLTRKMRRSGGRQLRLSEMQRYRMLCAMCADSPQLTVSPVEFGTVRAQTRETMAQLAEQYPQDELFFLIGADKLGMVAGWFEHPERIPPFRLLVVCRDGIDAKAFIASDPRTSAYADRFLILNIGEGMETVSSTRVRACMEEGTPLDDLVHPSVARMLEGMEDAFFEEITRFKDEYAFLALSFPSPVEYEGVVYPSAEAALYAARCAEESDRARFLRGTNPAATAAKCAPRADWAENRGDVLEEIVRAKFEQQPGLAAQLLATGDARLIAGGMKDLLFGVDLYTCRGDNLLGRVLMAIREEMKA